jgi:hypothetical protein
MRRLEKIGIVKRFDLGDGLARYAMLRNGDDGQSPSPRLHALCGGG